MVSGGSEGLRTRSRTTAFCDLMVLSSLASTLFHLNIYSSFLRYGWPQGEGILSLIAKIKLSIITRTVHN